jgi:hypothetical protein
MPYHNFMRRLIVITSVILTAALAASADELVITHGGRRVIDLDPTTAVTNCAGWSYDPAPVALENDISNVYSTSGILRNACDDRIPFSDEIWHGHRGPDGVFTVEPAITRTSFRWMFGDLPIDPQAYVGRVASPSVIRTADGRYFMAFIGSAADASLCSGVHTGQVCGLCLDPFSYYVMYWAVSTDGTTWHVLSRGNPVSNDALAAALLYRSPDSNDRAEGLYRGITRVRILVGDTYIWFLTQYETGGTTKTLLLRAPFDGKTEFGITGAIEAWRPDTSSWQTATDGVLPDQFNDPTISTGFYLPLVSIADITKIQGERYIGLVVDGSHIDYTLSNDLLSWTPPRALRSAIPYFADDRGYAGSVVDPTIVEDASNTLHLFMASDDGDSDHGVVRDGSPDCGSPSSTAGLGIYEGIVELAPLASTSLTITPRANPAGAGVVAFDIRVISSDGTSPNGRVAFSAGTFSTTVDVNNGRATVFAPLNTAATYSLHATFTTFGPWGASNADAQVTVVPGKPPKKRAVRH